MNPLQHRNFRLLLSGQLVSNLGSSLFVLALFWQVQASTKNPQNVAWLGLAMTLPSVTGFLTGAIVDRVNRQQLLWATDVVRFLLVGGLTVLLMVHAFYFWLVVPAFWVVNVAGNLFWPAMQTLLVDVVPVQDRTGAVGFMEASGQFSNAVAGLLGSFMIAALGSIILFAFNAATFLISVASLIALRLPRRPGVLPTRDRRRWHVRDWFAETREGLDGLWRWRVIRWVLPPVIVMNLAYAPFLALSPAWSANVLHRGPLGYSLLILAESVGSLGGSLLAGVLYRRWRGPLPWNAGLGLSLLLFLFPVIPTLPVDFGALLAFGLGTGMINTLFLGLIQRRIPDSVLGRTFSTLGTVFGAALPVGTALVGIFVGSVGLFGIFAAATAGIVAATVYLLTLLRFNPAVGREVTG